MTTGQKSIQPNDNWPRINMFNVDMPKVIWLNDDWPKVNLPYDICPIVNMSNHNWPKISLYNDDWPKVIWLKDDRIKVNLSNAKAKSQSAK